MPRKIRKAFITKVPEKYFILNSKGEIVDFGRSAFHAGEVARGHGAKTIEVKPWKDFFKSAM